jgi:hypothetical protein
MAALIASDLAAVIEALIAATSLTGLPASATALPMAMLTRRPYDFCCALVSRLVAA